MWREYTREKPARRGWALVLASAVFVGSMALAWGLTTGRISTSRMGSAIDFEGWPFRFAMPGGYELRTASSIAAEGDARGPGGMARYDANDREGRRSITIAFYQWPADLGWTELLRRLDIDDPEGGVDLSMGRQEWRVFEAYRNLTAVLEQPDGLIVVVYTEIRPRDMRPVTDLQAVCRSIKFK